MSYIEEREYYGVHRAVLLALYLRANAGREVSRAEARALIGGDRWVLWRALCAIEHVLGSQVHIDDKCIIYTENPR